MEDADPETQALLIKLHRELNQLPTRAARRQTTQASVLPLRTWHHRDNTSRQKQRQSRSPTPASTEDSPADKQKEEGTDGSSKKKQLETPGAADASQERASKKLKPNSKPARSLTQADSDQPSQRAKHESAASPPYHPPSSKPPTLADKQAADTDGSHATQQEAPISVVAAAACDAAKQKARQQAAHSSTSSALRQVKVFHAGVRWGVALPVDSVQSRVELAAALNDAFAGHIISCGRGDLLEVVVLDSSGAVTEFPSLRCGSSRESHARWQSCMAAAVKVYVRPDRPPALLL